MGQISFEATRYIFCPAGLWADFLQLFHAGRLLSCSKHLLNIDPEERMLKYILKNEIHHFEEPANAFTHGLGLLMSIVGFIFLIVEATYTGGALRIVSCAIYGATMILLYTSSTLYHSARPGPLKDFFRIMDHSTIYVFIAGSYTPFTLVLLGDAWGWSLFGVAWGLTLFGIVMKIFFTGKFDLLSTLIYLGMGWMSIVAIKPLVTTLPAGSLWWLLGGGLSYTAGTLFYLREKPFDHAIWHLFVLGGSVAHYFGIYYYVA